MSMYTTSGKGGGDGATTGAHLHAKIVVEWLKRLRAQHDKKKDDGAEKEWGSILQLKKTNAFLTVFQVALIILFGAVGGSEVLDPQGGQKGTTGYNMFVGVLIMMFIGFGYLMTFLKLYGLGALGLTLVITAMGLQWSLFTQSFFQQAMAPAARYAPCAWEGRRQRVLRITLPRFLSISLFS